MRKPLVIRCDQPTYLRWLEQDAVRWSDPLFITREVL